LKRRRAMRTSLHIRYEEQYPHDMLYHPSPAMKRLEKMIEEEDYNPSRRKKRKCEEILSFTKEQTTSMLKTVD
jgi:hypothetical protein